MKYHGDDVKGHGKHRELVQRDDVKNKTLKRFSIKLLKFWTERHTHYKKSLGKIMELLANDMEDVVSVLRESFKDDDALKQFIQQVVSQTENLDIKACKAFNYNNNHQLLTSSMAIAFDIREEFEQLYRKMFQGFVFSFIA